ncbi:AAA family ATPase [Sorangium sp. So ce513]|uniref:AAA family ATPase n=1 Tax=Sorangium sp. So ce513 TaxID=3133315 RepID=UPI003F643AE7
MTVDRDGSAEALRVALLGAAETALGAPLPALAALLGALAWPVRWTAGQARARRALAAWLLDEDRRRCVLHGPAGVGKTLLCAALAAEARLDARAPVLVPAGRAQGLALRHAVLALLDAVMRGAEGPPAPADTARLHRSVAQRIAGGREEDEPPWLLVLDGLDQVVLTPGEPDLDVLEDVGERTRVLVSVTGGLDEARAWCARLGGSEAETELVEIEAWTLREAEELDVALAARWAAADGAGPLERVAAMRLALRRRPDGARADMALAALARLLGPVDAEVLDEIAGEGAARALGAAREELAGTVRWIPGEERAAFAHEALRAAWERQTGADGTVLQARILERSRAALAAVDAAPAYLRAHVAAHLTLAGAGAEELRRLADPAWACATSTARASEVLADLRRARQALEHSVEQPATAGAASRPVAVALGAIARCALATAAVEERVAEARWAPAPLLAEEGARAGFDVARAAALCGLWRCASAGAGEGLVAEALDLAAGALSTAQLLSPPDLARELVPLAREAAARGRPGLARAALEALRRHESAAEREEAELLRRDQLIVLGFAPASEVRAWVEDVVARVRRGAAKASALARLVGDEGLAPDVALALRHGLGSAPLEERCGLLARLLPWLPAPERDAAIAEALEGWRRWMAEAEAEGAPPLDPASQEALTSWLPEPAALALLDDVPIWPAGPLAARLAALGHADRARALVLRWMESPEYRAPALLRVAGAASPEARAPLRAELLALAGALSGPARAVLVREQPAQAAAVLGGDEALAAAEAGADELGAYGALAALAAVAPHLPESLRPRAALRAAELYRDDPDSDALGHMVRLAPWMTPEDAAWLAAITLGDVAPRNTLCGVLCGWGSLAQLAPLLARAGGDDALLAAAGEVRAALW